jgi:hypothetical protein
MNPPCRPHEHDGEEAKKRESASRGQSLTCTAITGVPWRQLIDHRENAEPTSAPLSLRRQSSGGEQRDGHRAERRRAARPSRVRNRHAGTTSNPDLHEHVPRTSGKGLP